jgi:predicted DNA-binding transcriptional regulator YafY
MREDYRDFRTDRIKELTATGMKFENRNIKSIQDYMDEMMKQYREIEKVVLIVEKEASRYMSRQKYHYGLVSEDEQDNKVRMTFMTGYLESMAKWILLLGKGIEIESSERLKELVQDRVEELLRQYAPLEMPTR